MQKTGRTAMGLYSRLLILSGPQRLCPMKRTAPLMRAVSDMFPGDWMIWHSWYSALCPTWVPISFLMVSQASLEMLLRLTTLQMQEIKGTRASGGT